MAVRCGGIPAPGLTRGPLTPWEPSLRDDDIAVGVRDGVVTLAGFVDSYADKWTAERVVSKVKGVKAVRSIGISRRKRRRARCVTSPASRG